MINEIELDSSLNLLSQDMSWCEVATVNVLDTKHNVDRHTFLQVDLSRNIRSNSCNNNKTYKIGHTHNVWQKMSLQIATVKRIRKWEREDETPVTGRPTYKQHRPSLIIGRLQWSM